MSGVAAWRRSSWDGDGSASLAPDDSEWGGEARASGNNLDGTDDADVTELARSQVSLQSHLHTQALAFHLSAEDRAALGHAHPVQVGGRELHAGHRPPRAAVDQPDAGAGGEAVATEEAAEEGGGGRGGLRGPGSGRAAGRWP